MSTLSLSLSGGDRGSPRGGNWVLDVPVARTAVADREDMVCREAREEG
jgi:hypothetical protein